VLKGAKSCKIKGIILSRKLVMTPEQKAVLQQHVNEIAKILYADCDPDSLQTLADIETTVRDKMLEHVNPEIGFFLSTAKRKQRQAENASSKVVWEN
jgi:hypothetical protein